MTWVLALAPGPCVGWGRLCAALFSRGLRARVGWAQGAEVRLVGYPTVPRGAGLPDGHAAGAKPTTLWHPVELGETVGQLKTSQLASAPF